MSGPLEKYAEAEGPWANYAQPEAPADEPFPAKLGRGVLNAAAGAVRGAGSIGSTLLYPIDKATDLIKGDRGPNITSLVTGKQPLSRNQERRQSMTEALGLLGADTDSLAFGAGKLGGEIAGTAGAGGGISNMLARIPGLAAAVPSLLQAIGTGGMSAGNATGLMGQLARAGGGAVNAGAATGLANPEDAGSGALIGGLLPGGVQLSGMAGDSLSRLAQWVSRRLMQSAVKPTIQQLKTGDAQTAIQTLLDQGINPTGRGVEQLRALIDDLNAQIKSKVAGSTATVPRQDVLNTLGDVRAKFGNQVSPSADLAAIQRVADDFVAHPAVPPDIPVQVAQDLKQGTYRVLNGKFGQLGSAETEAQKGLARGLKEGVAKAVPDVVPLNAEEAKLLKTLSVVERRALMELNKNPVGLSALAGNPAGFIAFMADRSAAFKSLAARMINASANAGGNKVLLGAASNPLLRNAALISAETNP